MNTTPKSSPAPLVVPPPMPAAPHNPLPTLPQIPLDEKFNRVGIAQTVARAAKAQTRMLWVDATANLARINSEEKCRAIVMRVKDSGFNTLVVDGKPIIGHTIYPSRYAPKLTEWNKPGYSATLPKEFDPMAVFARICREQNISLLVSMNAFSEGHRDMQKGLAYDNPTWQTVLYEEQPRLKLRENGTTLADSADVGITVNPKVNELTDSIAELGVYTDVVRLIADLTKRGGNRLVVIFNDSGQIIATALPESVARLSLEIPAGGSAVVSWDDANTKRLTAYATVGKRAVLESAAAYVPIGLRPKRQVPVMTNPFNPIVRQRILDMIAEVATNYDIDGVIFDDRLRYAGLDADFSPEARAGFEKYVNQKVKWPDDVFRTRYLFPTMAKATVTGPLFEAWLTFRALHLRNWVADASATLKNARPTAIFATYVGSWFPDYADVGANWSATTLNAGLRFLTTEYARTGWADLCDLIVTGCYYRTPTIADAVAKAQNIGETIEATAQFSNRAVDDAAWCVAGISLADFANRPEELKRALQAACAATQGVMVFDFSHNIEASWPVFAAAFAETRRPAHVLPALLSDIRRQKVSERASGKVAPPVILYRGTSGTGF